MENAQKHAVVCPFDYVNAAAANARIYAVMTDAQKRESDPAVLKARRDYEDFCSSLFTITSDSYKENSSLEDCVSYSDYGKLVISYGKYILKKHPELTLEWVQEVCAYTRELLTKWDPEQNTPFLCILKQECQPRGKIGHSFVKNHLDYKWVWKDVNTDEIYPCTEETRELAKRNGWTQVIQEYKQVSMYEPVKNDDETRRLDIFPLKESSPYTEAESDLTKSEIMNITRLTPFELDLFEMINIDLGNKISPQNLPSINALCKKYDMPVLTLAEAKKLKRYIYLTIRIHRGKVRKCICGNN